MKLLPTFCSDFRFKTSRNSHIIEVNLYDEIDFICPYAPFELDESQQEFYIIYQVSYQQVVLLYSFRLLGYLVFLSSGKEVQNLRKMFHFTNDSGDKSESFDGDVGE